MKYISHVLHMLFILVLQQKTNHNNETKTQLNSFEVLREQHEENVRKYQEKYKEEYINGNIRNILLRVTSSTQLELQSMN